MVMYFCSFFSIEPKQFEFQKYNFKINFQNNRQVNRYFQAVNCNPIIGKLIVN